jgi:uncharacterized protein YkwD
MFFLRHAHLLAFSVAVVLTAGLAVVFADEPSAGTDPQAQYEAAPPAIETTTTVIVIDPIVDSGFVLSEAIAEITELAVARSTSTTTSTTEPPPTTTTAPKTNPKPPPQPTPTTQPTPATPPTTVTAEFRSDLEAEFRSKVNSLRSSNGLAALSSDGSLNSYARSWAKHMATKNKLSHSNLGALIPPWKAAGENVGMGGSVSGVFGLLAGSSGHLQNMVGDYTHIGVGVWIESDGTIWTSHVFAR